MANSERKSVLPWGLSEEQLKPNSVEELSKDKLKAFSIGGSNPVVLKANPFHKKREEKQIKKELEAKETAKVFEDFVASFQEASKTTKLFVRGNVINPDNKDEGEQSAGSLYQPTSKLLKAVEDKEEEAELTPTPAKKSSKKKSKPSEKKKSILELFGEELKRMQDERNERYCSKKVGEVIDQPPPSEMSEFPQDKEQCKAEDLTSLPKGSFDSGDPLTTNLYVGNINPKMNEEMLCQHFGKFGPLASIKIMWPRTEEEKSRNRNCGFVAFMRRGDAEKALEAMKGSTIMSYEVQVGWGKAVPLPPKPFYVAPDNEIEVKKFVPDPPSGLPFNAQLLKRSKPPSGNQYGNVPPPDLSAVGSDHERSEEHRFDDFLFNSIVRVVIPSDMEILCLIHRMIEFVIREGPMFEAMIMNKEIGNPKFRFLFDNSSLEHVYYRWKLFSILQGDSPETWHVDEFRMFEGGSLWKPPPLKNLRGKVMPPIMEIVKKGQLPSDYRDHLEDMLRNITMERTKVKEAMVWCLEHAESAEEISECVCESLSISETPLPLKIARLYLMNDILQNSSARITNASRYRTSFESKLIPVIEHLHTVLANISSRLRAESFKRRVLKCLQAWDQLSVYHFNFVDKLRELFIGKTQEELEKKKAFETVAALMSDSNNPDSTHTDDLDSSHGIPIPDNRPIDFSGGGTLGGLTFDDNEDLDGEPLVDPDLDGVPIEEDLDGVPMDTEPLVVPSNTKVVQSKWELVDYGKGSSSENEEESFNTVEKKDKLPSSKCDVKATDSDEEKKRQMLRDVELKVLELVEALEKSGSYTSNEIAERAAKFREKLVLEATQSNTTDHTPSLDSLKKSDLEEKTPNNVKREENKRNSPPRKSRKHSSRDGSSSPHEKDRGHHRSRSPNNKKRKHTSPSRKRSPDRRRSIDKRRSPGRKSRSRSPQGHSRHRSKSPHSYKRRSRSPHTTPFSSRKERHRSRSKSPSRRNKRSKH